MELILLLITLVILAIGLLGYQLGCVAGSQKASAAIKALKHAAALLQAHDKWAAEVFEAYESQIEALKAELEAAKKP